MIDCPGYDAPLARAGHGLADTLVTPLNDSLMDVELLAEMDGGAFDARAPGVYASMVWQQRRERLVNRGAGLDWLVMRNRLSSLANRNQRMMTDLLPKLAGDLGFRVADGFGERTIYRELFFAGLTILDLQHPDFQFKLSKSHRSAVDEVKDLIKALWLPRLEGRLEEI